MRHQQSGQIGNAFIQDLPALHATIGQWTIAIKLCRQFFTNCPILVSIFRRPPIAQAPAVVINIAQFIEAVADFVGHAGPRRAVVGSGIARNLEKWRLKDRAVADSFATNEALLAIIVQLFERGEFNKIRLANKAIAKFEAEELV